MTAWFAAVHESVVGAKRTFAKISRSASARPMTGSAKQSIAPRKERMDASSLPPSTFALRATADGSLVELSGQVAPRNEALMKCLCPSKADLIEV
jgi:hypothetical protein